MKTILVPAGGSDTDKAVFATALSLARPLSAHLEFLHIRPGLDEVAAHTPHLGFAMGSGVQQAMDELEQQTETRAGAARRRFDELCRDWSVDVLEEPQACRRASASFHEETGNGLSHIMRRARHADAVVVGRRTRPNVLPADMMERLLLESGRPVVVAPAQPPEILTDTIVVCWKETPEAARALTAAMPLLTVAKRVLIVGVQDRELTGQDTIDDVARHLGWHGIRAQARWIAATAHSIAEELASVARECRAGLLVMGGFGHSRTRQRLFGGCTQSFLAAADLPVFLVH